MRTRLFLTLLGFACLVNFVKSACDLTKRKNDVEFPDIMKYVAESYIMGVEYSIPGVKQTDYYTEYYDNAFVRGRVDSHISGENKKYIYRSTTWEAWTIEGRKCDLKNITVTPDFFKSDQTDWMHFKGSESPTTIGPSAMFKVAYDAWKNPSKDKKKMAYMGKADKDIRGEPAVFWRRCTEGDNYVDYFFAAENAENPFDTDAFSKVITPLRVVFNGISGQDKELSQQYYDIISFQHLIPAGVEPFYLPKGLNCQRGDLVDDPSLPDFSANSILLNAEVLYEKYDTKDGYELMSSYVSTLMFALDRDINHLAYYYSSWNTTKPDKEHKEPSINSPFYFIYDITHGFAYNLSFENAKCEITRNKGISPKYSFPENGGSLPLDNPYVLFPNNELDYLSKGIVRGLKVNIFEAEIKGFLLDKDTSIDRVIATHSYLTSEEISENSVEVKQAPAQIQLRLYRKPNTEEVVTFNIFGFTTRIPYKRYIFDISRCFKNDDDYSYLTIGFEVPPVYIPEMPKKLTQIQENLMNRITEKSELNAVRVPKIMTDIKDDYVYATVLIIDKPPVMLDFTDETEGKDQTISVSNEAEDTQGLSDFKTCAQACLETRNECWGFSLCGATCYFGSSKNTEVKTQKDCTLYKRYRNDTYVQSKEQQINNIVGQIKGEQFMVEFISDSGERVELKATSAQVTDPAEDESLFDKMGNQLNPRMTVHKAGAKLKKGAVVKNFGKLRFDECQRLCLDFKDCETISYCLNGAACIISNTYGSELKPEDIEDDPFCNLVTRNYLDHFDRTPGVILKVGGGTEKGDLEVDDCAKACLKESQFKCLSFDHCSVQKKGCTLYATHYLNPKSRKEATEKDVSCGHYTRKFSNDFTKKVETRVLGSTIPPITNLTLEECAKNCIEYGKGTCYGYDFCQDATLFATSCTLFDTDPSRLKSTYNPVCTHYARAGEEFAPRPFTNSYAGGIGFVCFIVGGVVGAIVIFAIAYIRVNRR